MDKEHTVPGLSAATDMLADASDILVFTGSGISAESGIATFRGAGGLWEGKPIEDVATPEGFARDPEGVWQWYNDRRAQLQHLEPNAAHYAVARLQRRMGERGERCVVVTQNVDGLHQRAGATGVLELHGTLEQMRCSRCDHHEKIALDPVEPVPSCPACGAPQRPAVVWFGEALPPDVWQAAGGAATTCDLLLAVGTSALVYPAAGLIECAVGCGAGVIEVNTEVTAASAIVSVSLRGKAGQVLPQLVG
jgi:NAD-dependent deacetylase